MPRWQEDQNLLWSDNWSAMVNETSAFPVNPHRETLTVLLLISSLISA